MDDKTYNDAWDVVEPVMQEYIELRRHWSFTRGKGISQDQEYRARKDYELKKDMVLAPFGITFSQLCYEHDKRLGKSLLRLGVANES